MKKLRIILISLLLALAIAAGVVLHGGNVTDINDGGNETISQTDEKITQDETEPPPSSQSETKSAEASSAEKTEPAAIDENGKYYSKDEVALYIHTYGRLPSNYITKKEAQKLGWQNGSVDPYFPGGAIGGSRFGNYEGQLPEGKTYYECDIDTLGKSSRGAKRIVYSDDGSIYYTGDHYETFTQLY